MFAADLHEVLTEEKMKKESFLSLSMYSPSTLGCESPSVIYYLSGTRLSRRVAIGFSCSMVVFQVQDVLKTAQRKLLEGRSKLSPNCLIWHRTQDCRQICRAGLSSFCPSLIVVGECIRSNIPLRSLLPDTISGLIIPGGTRQSIAINFEWCSA